MNASSQLSGSVRFFKGVSDLDCLLTLDADDGLSTLAPAEAEAALLLLPVGAAVAVLCCAWLWF